MRMDTIKCSHCGKDLPKEANFCPYCMERINQPNVVMLPQEKKKTNKKAILIIATAIVLVFALILGTVIFKGAKNSEQEVYYPTVDEFIKNYKKAHSDALNDVECRTVNGGDTCTIFVSILGDECLEIECSLKDDKIYCISSTLDYVGLCYAFGFTPDDTEVAMSGASMEAILPALVLIEMQNSSKYDAAKQLETISNELLLAAWGNPVTSSYYSTTTTYENCVVSFSMSTATGNFCCVCGICDDSQDTEKDKVSENTTESTTDAVEENNDDNAFLEGMTGNLNFDLPDSNDYVVNGEPTTENKNETTTDRADANTSPTTNDTVTDDECSHNWVAITETVYHEEEGHYEDVQKQRPVKRTKCPVCYECFDAVDIYYDHFDSTHTPSYDGDPIKALRNQYTTVNDYEYYTVQEWVVDEDAYSETVVVGYECSFCGKEK